MEKRKITTDLIFEHGKVPPQAVELEEVVIGACLLESEAFDTIASILRPEVFYKTEHQIIFKTINQLIEKGSRADILTVTDQLRNNGELELVGGPYAIAILTNRVASSASIEFHSRIILQKFIQRELIRVSSIIIKEAFEDTTDVLDLVDEADRMFQGINELTVSGGTMKHISVVMDKVEGELKHRENLFERGVCTGIPTGFEWLDRIINGWQKSNLIILGGRPGMGKTALALKFLKAAAMAGHSGCIYSLEMSDVKLGDRLTLSETNIHPDDFAKGRMTPERWEDFYDAKKKISRLGIYVDDNAIVKMGYIRRQSKLMKKKGKCDFIIIDYLQLADMRSEEKNRNREQEVSQASRMAKIIAKDLDVPVILLSQLSRKCEERGDKKPILSDLRESGGLEQDADIVMFAFRPEMYGTMEDSEGVDLHGYGELIIAKNRDGACETVKFSTNKSMTKITDYTPSI